MSTSITLEGFYRKAGKLIPWFMSAALVLFVVGVYQRRLRNGDGCRPSGSAVPSSENVRDAAERHL